MAVLLYNIILFLFRSGIFIASWFDPKAKKWVRGRKGLLEKLEKAISPNEKIIWVHCASLGEFEQGRPVMEGLKKNFPDHRILLSFFSPSGYESQKNFSGADYIFYLPLDGPKSARRFLEITRPGLVIFVKYEFWYYYLKKIKYRNIPLLLISALFRKDMSFFKWYGGLQQKMLSRFDQLFVQDRSSLELLKGIGLEKISSISGDTRFDRVKQIAATGEELPFIKEFLGNVPALVAGSTWPEDEEVLRRAFQKMAPGKLKWIIAPHEISEKHIEDLKRSFPEAITYAALKKQPSVNADVLIIDNVGMLSRLYRYGRFSFVGGGFMKMGVHNVLEPAVYSKPVFMGPFFQKYQEAKGLVASGGGLVVENEEQLKAQLEDLLKDGDRYATVSKAAGDYVHANAGATQIILDYIQEKRLLTS